MHVYIYLIDNFRRFFFFLRMLQVGIVDEILSEYALKECAYSVKFPNGERQAYVHANLRRIEGATGSEV